MNDRILCSVLMITYNHEKYIAQAIDSVLMQKTNFDFEIVIGEDCSTDRTREIVLEYKAKHPDKIKLLLQEKNVGMMQNFIDTLNACKGKYIAMLEGDDYWTDQYKLKKQVDILEAHPEYSMCFTARNVVDSDNKFLREEHYPDKIYTTKDVVEGFIPSTQTIVLRNYQDLHKFLYQNHNHPSGDRLITYYCSLLGNIYYLDEITATYRDSGTGVWSSFDIIEKEKLSFSRLQMFYEILGIESNNEIVVSKALIYIYYKTFIKKEYVFIIKNFIFLFKTYITPFGLLKTSFVFLDLAIKRIKKYFIQK